MLTGASARAAEHAQLLRRDGLRPGRHHGRHGRHHRPLHRPRRHARRSLERGEQGARKWMRARACGLVRGWLPLPPSLRRPGLAPSYPRVTRPFAALAQVTAPPQRRLSAPCSPATEAAGWRGAGRIGRRALAQVTGAGRATVSSVAGVRGARTAQSAAGAAAARPPRRTTRLLVQVQIPRVELS